MEHMKPSEPAAVMAVVRFKGPFCDLQIEHDKTSQRLKKLQSRQKTGPDEIQIRRHEHRCPKRRGRSKPPPPSVFDGGTQKVWPLGHELISRDGAWTERSRLSIPLFMQVLRLFWKCHNHFSGLKIKREGYKLVFTLYLMSLYIAQREPQLSNFNVSRSKNIFFFLQNQASY